MLWGCETAEEHYNAIAKAVKLHQLMVSWDWKVLNALGFDFRMLHSSRCTCNPSNSTDDVVSESILDEDNEE